MNMKAAFVVGLSKYERQMDYAEIACSHALKQIQLYSIDGFRIGFFSIS
jgi:hypothetical protein